MPKLERLSLGTALNAPLASPRTGAPLDSADWLAPRSDGRTPVINVAHFDEDERMRALGS